MRILLVIFFVLAMTYILTTWDFHPTYALWCTTFGLFVFVAFGWRAAADYDEMDGG